MTNITDKLADALRIAAVIAGEAHAALCNGGEMRAKQLLCALHDPIYARSYRNNIRSIHDALAAYDAMPARESLEIPQGECRVIFFGDEDEVIEDECHIDMSASRKVLASFVVDVPKKEEEEVMRSDRTTQECAVQSAVVTEPAAATSTAGSIGSDVGQEGLIAISDAPAKIYLCVGDIGEPGPLGAETWADADGITWCADKIDEYDIPYVRSDLATGPDVGPARTTWINTDDHTANEAVVRQALADTAATLDRVTRERDEWKHKAEQLESLRPLWAQGNSVDSVSAQVLSAAIAQLWKILGVCDQTNAVNRLRALQTDDARDAARYRWLRARRKDGPAIAYNPWQGHGGLFDDDADDVVDAAMAKGGAK